MKDSCAGNIIIKSLVLEMDIVCLLNGQYRSVSKGRLHSYGVIEVAVQAVFYIIHSTFKEKLGVFMK